MLHQKSNNIIVDGSKGKTTTYLGASMVKWTTLDLCSGLSESDPKLYPTFELYEIEIYKHLENICTYKAKQVCLQKTFAINVYLF